MLAKSTQYLLLLLIALRTGAADSRLLGFPRTNVSVPVNAGPSQKPKTQKDSTHISDFTDPDTGLNPFLDLQEGRTDAFGRRFKDRDRPLPRPYLPPVSHSDVIEGDPDGGRGRGGDSRPQMTVNPRWRMVSNPPGRNDYVGVHANEESTTNRDRWRKFDFDLFAETTPPTASEEPLSTQTSSTTRTTPPSNTSSHDVTASSRTSNGVTDGFDDVEAEAVTSTPENPFSSNVTMSALIIGSVLAVLALSAAFAWKCISKRRRGERGPAYVESLESGNGEATDYSANGRDSKCRK